MSMPTIPLPDLLGRLMQDLRFSGVLCSTGQFVKPWGLSGKSVSMPLFHYIREGSCILTLNGEKRRVAQGDLVVLPRGHSHLLSDGSGLNVHDVQTLLRQRDEAGRYQVKIGEGVSSTRLICGIFTIDKQIDIPFWNSLPPIIHIQQNELQDSRWLPGMLDFLYEESAGTSQGSSLMMSKISEMIFLLALRTFLERNQHSQAGWLQAIQEPRLRRALWLIHTRYAEPWTLEQLAKDVGMSRALFASTFKKTTAESPIQYLTKVRMQQAVRMIQSSKYELKEIAYHIGFHSHVGFHNAFKRFFGVTPGAYRHQQKSKKNDHTT